MNLLDLDQQGVAIVGHIQKGLPSIGFPHAVSMSDYFVTAAAAIGVMLVAFAEGLASAKTYATLDHYDIEVNRD